MSYGALRVVAFFSSFICISISAQTPVKVAMESELPLLCDGSWDVEYSSKSTAAIRAHNATLVEPADAFVYTPLSLKDKWLFSISQIFGASRLLAYAANALYDQIYDVPKQWGSSGDSLAIRLANHFGDSLIRYNLQFVVQSLDREDPRYFRSHLHGGWHRTRYAVLHTFVVRNDDQSWMPAYSRLVTDFGMPYIIRQWRPERFYAMSDLEAANMGLGIQIGSNILTEFWPDLKRKLTSVPLLRPISHVP